jgi:hypothetical protein
MQALQFRFPVGSTSKSVLVWIGDPGSIVSVQLGKPGLSNDGSSIFAAYIKLGTVLSTAIPIVDLGAYDSPYTAGGWFEMDSAGAVGWYRFDLPDAMLSTVGFVGLRLFGNDENQNVVDWNGTIEVYDPAMTLTSAYDFAKGTAAMAEAYAANGVAPTPVQALFAIHQMLMQFSISGTNITVKKLNNSTTAFIVGTDSATAPTSAART